MPASIQAIRVKNLGPIDEIDWTLGPVNVVYGHNEKGKTCLVEFLLRSLFRSAGDWPLREIAGAGRVLVEGIDGEVTEFSPDSGRKLEDYWEDQDLGYPPDLARLLVVKGAELEMARDVAGGVNRAVVRQYLSQTAVLESIKGEIQKTIYQATIENGEIVGASMGRLKDRLGFMQERDDLGNLVRKINQDFTSGRLASLERQEADLEERLRKQQLAKRHLAYQLQERQKGIRDQIKDYPLDELNTLEKNLEALDRLRETEERKQEQANSLADAAGDFAWLKQTLDTLREHPGVGEAPSYWWLVLSVLSLLGGSVAAYFQQPIIAAAAAAAGMGLAWWYVRKWTHWQEVRPDEETRADLLQTFQNRFDQEAADEPAMRAKLEELREQASRYSILQEELEDGKRDQREMASQIRNQFRRFKRTALTPEEWGLAAAGLREERKELESRESSLELELARLNVSTEDVIPEDVGVTYEAAEVSGLEDQLLNVRADIEEEKQRIAEVQASIRRHTGAHPGARWNELLQELQAAYDEKADAYRSLTATILGQNLIAHALEEMLAEEDDNIKARLQSELVKEPLKAITGRYDRVEMVGDQLLISDAYQSFPLDELSTGAQEQVLLALRMAFAAQLLGDERLFLILDDAFQYADWERREWLVNQMVELGKNGWQILYFTMDDHLLGLFEKRGKRSFKDSFQSFRLPTD